MKNSKSRNDNRKYYNDDYDDEEFLDKKKREERHRRPVKNWKKAWVEHQSDYDDRDEFFGK